MSESDLAASQASVLVVSGDLFVWDPVPPFGGSRGHYGAAFGDPVGEDYYYASVPEPLTILGSITAAGFGVAFKRKKNSTKEE